MMKSMSRLMVTAAAAGMAFAPVAAQANTRAGDSAPVYTAQSSETSAQPGTNRNADGENIAGVPALIGALLAAAAAAGVIVIVADDDDDDQSPGT